MRKIFLLALLLTGLFGISQITLAQTASTTPHAITRPLYVGVSGDDVSFLQTFLKSKNYFTYPTITGYFGSFTWKAVSAFQYANGLESVGSVGPKTRALINGFFPFSPQATTSVSTTTVPNIPFVVSPTATTSPSILPTFCPFFSCPGNGYTPGFGGGGGASAPAVVQPSPTGEYYADSVSGNDSNDGFTASTPWKTLAKANSFSAYSSGNTLYLKKSSTFTDRLTVPANNFTVTTYGSGTTPIIDGGVSVMGTTTDWFEVGSDGVTPQASTNRWRRAFTNANGSRYLLVSNGAWTSWRQDTASAVDATGEWYLGTDNLIVYATSNPATFFTTLAVNSTGNGVDADSRSGTTISTLEVKGFERGFVFGGSATFTDIYAHLCAGVGIKFTSGGTIVGTRPIVYDSGYESVTDGTDVESYGIYFKGPSSNSSVYNVSITDARVDNTRDDNVKSESSVSSNSTFRLLSSTNGATRLTRPGYHENSLDNQGGNWEITGAFLDAGPDSAGNQPHPTIDAIGSVSRKTALTDSIVNARGTDYPVYTRGSSTYLETLRSAFYSAGADAAIKADYSGQHSKINFSILYAGGAGSAAYRVYDGDHDLTYSTLVGQTIGLTPQRTTRTTSGVTLAQVSGPDGNGDYTYSMTRVSTGVKMGEGQYFQLSGMSGASAALNGVWHFITFTAPDTSTDIGTFLVAGSLNPPATVDQTGLVINNVSRLAKLDGNFIAGTSDVVLLSRSWQLPATTYNANALDDFNATDRPWRNDFSILAGLDDGTIRRFTSPQVKATAASAGNLSYESSGKIGGTGWQSENVVAAPLNTQTASSIVVSSGVATVTLTGHGYATGQRVLITGATPDALNGWHWITVTGANTFTFSSNREVTDQTASGTILARNGVMRSGAAGLGTAPTIDVSAISTTDFNGNAIPVSGRNFGAVQP